MSFYCKGSAKFKEEIEKECDKMLHSISSSSLVETAEMLFNHIKTNFENFEFSSEEGEVFTVNCSFGVRVDCIWSNSNV